jgi:glycosyltransferase involved in cell wall biosynthesis
MKAMINIGHGEGYGLPLFEAAYHGLPLITTTWSGQMDFICKPNKKGKQIPRVIKVDYDLLNVQKTAVWDGVVQADSKWAFPKENSFKRGLRDLLEKEQYWKSEAQSLKNYVHDNFTKDKLYEQFCNSVFEGEVLTMPEESIDDLFAKLENNR